MIERFIELGMLITVTLISLGVGIMLFRNAKKHERAVRSLDKEIETKLGLE
jgi:cbb3-type cytochrome oxidase subunit 3